MFIQVHTNALFTQILRDFTVNCTYFFVALSL